MRGCLITKPLMQPETRRAGFPRPFSFFSAVMEAETDDFIEGVKQPTWRGMRVSGQRVATWSSRDGWSEDGV
jgi:hypothetical protein